MRGRFRRLVALIVVLTLTLSVFAAARAEADESAIEDILARFLSNDELCESAPQQSVNGVYRCAELLAVIAYEFDSTGAYGSAVDDVLARLVSNDERCESALQQTANGVCRCAERWP